MQQQHRPHVRAVKQRLDKRLDDEAMANVKSNWLAWAASVTAGANTVKSEIASKATAMVGTPVTATASATKAATTSAATPVVAHTSSTSPAAAKPTTAAAVTSSTTTAKAVAPTTSTAAKAAVTTSAEPSTEEEEELTTTKATTTPTTHAATLATTSKASLSHATAGTVTSANRAISSSAGASAAAAAAGGSSSGLGSGAIAGIVICVLLALGAIGAFAMYFLKKHKARGYGSSNGWAKMDDDVTPFPSQSEKPGGYYGAAPASQPGGTGGYGATALGAAAGAGAAQSRGLGVQNDYYQDGRPHSEMSNENFAGYGAGRVHGAAASPLAPVASYPIQQQQQNFVDNAYSPEHVVPSPYYGNPNEHDQYGMQQQQSQYQYPQHAQYPQQQQQHHQGSPFDDPSYSPTHDASAPRQLVGPGQQYQQPYGAVAPVPLGRPQAPNSYDDIAAAEMYADDRYADDHMAAPVPVPVAVPVARHTDSDPPYSPQLQRLSPSPNPAQQAQLVDHQYPEHQAYADQQQQQQHGSPVPQYQTPPQQAQQWPDEKALYKEAQAQAAATAVENSPPTLKTRSPAPAPVPLPQLEPIQLEPMSPLMTTMSLQDAPAPAPVPARAAAAPHAITSHEDGDETARMYAEVSAAAGLPMTSSHAPYQHGQPLAPVREVDTPAHEPPRPLPSVPGTPITPTTQAVAPSPPAKAPLPAIPVAAAAPAAPARLPAAPAAALEHDDDDDAYGGM